MSDEGVAEVVRESKRAAAAMIAENHWRLPASYEMFVAMVATAYACGQRDAFSEIVARAS